MESFLPVTLELPGADDRVNFDIDNMAQALAPVLNKKETGAADSKATESSHTDSSDTVAAHTMTVNKTALALALCGWTGQELSTVKLAYCAACFSRVGLWIYAEDMTFNPVTLHRIHCPWQNPVSQSALGIHSGLAAWQVLAELIRGKMLRNDKQKETLDGEGSDGEDFDSPRQSREDVDQEDKVREGRLSRLKRAFTVKKGGTRKS